MLDFEKISLAVAKAEETASKAGIAVSTAVVDEAGNLVYFHRMPNALVVSPDFAIAKAFTAATLRMPTKMIADFAAEGKPYAGFRRLNKKFTTIAGGFPIMMDDQVIGAIGVGGSPDPAQDAECAQAALSVLA